MRLLASQALRSRVLYLLGVFWIAAPRGGLAAFDDPLPTMESVLGFDPCAEGALLNSVQATRYLRALERSTKLIRVTTIGLSTDGRPITCAVISSPENLARLERERPGVDPFFVLVTCAVHPAEVGSTPAGLRLIQELLGGASPRAREILQAMILLVIPCMNPDGTDRVASWLRAGGDEAGERLPFLQHRFTGHDLNRDWLLGTQAETRAVIEQVHNRYRPWLTIDLHQMSWNGPRLFVPPYLEPTDPEAPEALVAAVNTMGRSVLSRMTAAGFQGVTHRFNYDAWSPARGYPFYHGGLRLLLECASGRFQKSMDVSPQKLQAWESSPSSPADHPSPWPGGSWGLPQITRTLATAAELALESLLDEDLKIARAESWAHLGPPGRVLLEPAGHASVEAGELIEALALTGARVSVARDGARWLVEDPEWGRGWCRSLLLPRMYPATVTAPYDTTAHCLALLAGCRSRALLPQELSSFPAGSWVKIGGQSIRNAPTRLEAARASRLLRVVPLRDSADEGWIRWILEDRGFEFAAWDPGRDSETEPQRLVVILPERSGNLESSSMDALRRAVRRGARAVAIGRSAHGIVQASGWGLEEVSQAAGPVRGAILRTEIQPGRADDPLLKDFTTPPAVLFDQGPAWKPSAGQAVEPILALDHENPLLSGLLTRDQSESLRGSWALIRARDGEGEWLLFGFLPCFRGWTTESARLLVNAIAAP